MLSVGLANHIISISAVTVTVVRVYVVSVRLVHLLSFRLLFGGIAFIGTMRVLVPLLSVEYMPG